MKESNHLEKASRIVRSLRHCGANDYEIKIEGAMLAATHYANIALHRLGITSVEWDIIHSDFLTVMDHVRFELLEPRLLAALEGIEELRPPWVRGDANGGQAAGDRALELLQVVRSEALIVQSGRLVIQQYRPWEKG